MRELESCGGTGQRTEPPPPTGHFLLKKVAHANCSLCQLFERQSRSFNPNWPVCRWVPDTPARPLLSDIVHVPNSSAIPPGKWTASRTKSRPLKTNHRDTEKAPRSGSHLCASFVPLCLCGCLPGRPVGSLLIPLRRFTMLRMRASADRGRMTGICVMLAIERPWQLSLGARRELHISKE